MIVIHIVLFAVRFVLTNQNDNHTQNVFEVDVKSFATTYVNPDFFRLFEVGVFKYNRTIQLGKYNLHNKFTIVDLRLRYKLFKYSNMEYKFMGIQSTIDACNTLKHNYYGAIVFKTLGNYTDCPLLPAKYVLENYQVDSSKLPPLIPEGTYKCAYKIYVNNSKEEAAAYEAIGQVKYPLRKRRRN